MWGPRVLFQGSSYAYARANRAEAIGGSGKQPILHATDAVLISSFHVVGFPHLETKKTIVEIEYRPAGTLDTILVKFRSADMPRLVIHSLVGQLPL